MNWEILYKYVQGTCTEEELRKLGRWLGEDPANEDFFTSFVEEWQDVEIDKLDSDAQAAWHKFRNRSLKSVGIEGGTSDFTVASGRAADKPPRVIRIKEKNRRGAAYWAYSAAAVMILAIALIFVIREFNSTTPAEQQETISYQEISTTRGQRTNLKLSDGTQVVLNSSSRLLVPNNFGVKTRRLYLEGQAYYNVTHNPDMPFEVYSKNSFTRVLGTKFDVKAYPEDEQVQVVVEEGRVALGSSAGTDAETYTDTSNPNPEINTANGHVTKGQIGLLKEDGQTVVSDTDEIQRYLGWTEGRLIFNSTPLGEAIPQLQRWYDIEIVLADPFLRSENLTASFKDEPMTEVMNIISLSLKMHYERAGRTFTFYSNSNREG